MRRLYLQIYLAFVAILLVFGVLMALAWLILDEDPEHQRSFDGLAVLMGDLLPDRDQPGEHLQRALASLAEQFNVAMAVIDEGGRVLASAGGPVRRVDPGRTSSGWLKRRRGGWGAALHLPDGRWVTVYLIHRHGLGWLGALVLFAVAVAIGAYPIVRRITRRLERLQRQVEALGAGDLASRVAVEGSDEVAELAKSFNRAAEQIEGLVDSQRSMLASASHELRSPLARIRVAIELLAGDDRADLRERVARDIAELDDLIEELLFASRLEVLETIGHEEAVDLLALMAEEGARVDAEVSGDAAVISADPRLLRRLLRNLFENARRHGGAFADSGESPDSGISRTSGTSGTSGISGRAQVLADYGVTLTVCDRGPGIPESERECVFEPFYRPVGMKEGDRGGVGLGLYLVRQIAARHRGTVRYAPGEDGGSCFEVRLPESASSTGPDRQASAPSLSAHPSVPRSVPGGGRGK